MAINATLVTPGYMYRDDVKEKTLPELDQLTIINCSTARTDHVLSQCRLQLTAERRNILTVCCRKTEHLDNTRAYTCNGLNMFPSCCV